MVHYLTEIMTRCKVSADKLSNSGAKDSADLYVLGFLKISQIDPIRNI